MYDISFDKCSFVSGQMDGWMDGWMDGRVLSSTDSVLYTQLYQESAHM